MEIMVMTPSGSKSGDLDAAMAAGVAAALERASTGENNRWESLEDQVRWAFERGFKAALLARADSPLAVGWTALEQRIGHIAHCDLMPSWGMVRVSGEGDTITLRPVICPAFCQDQGRGSCCSKRHHPFLLCGLYCPLKGRLARHPLGGEKSPQYNRSRKSMCNMWPGW